MDINNIKEIANRCTPQEMIAAMATNPLLLTMIAVVHDNRGALPVTRVETLSVFG